MISTPVLLLIFNRPYTTKKVFDAIRLARPKQLFIAADGPRTNVVREKEICQEVISIATAVDWDCEVKTLFRKENLGCKRAVSDAISWFFNNVEEGIILEDDCLPEKSFFSFCETMLQKYRNEENIMVICGTNYFFNKVNYDYDFYFSNLVFIWGWATWKRAWKKNNLNIIRIDPDYIYNRFSNKTYSDYLHNSSSKVLKNELNTWDISWTYSVFENNGLSVIPIKNQIKNIGYYGTHTYNDNSIFFNMPTLPIDMNHIKTPDNIIVDETLDNITMKNILAGENMNSTYFAKFKNAIKSIILR